MPHCHASGTEPLANAFIVAERSVQNAWLQFHGPGTASPARNCWNNLGGEHSTKITWARFCGSAFLEESGPTAVMPGRFEFKKKAKRQIRSMRQRGCSLREIAIAIGCSRTTLRAKGFNLGSLRRRFTKEEENRMVTMRRHGFTLQQISIALGCCQTVVRRRVRNLGPVPLLEARPVKPKTPAPKQTRRLVLDLRKRGHSFEKIANTVGLSPCGARSIVMTGEEPVLRDHPSHWEETSEDKIARVIALRRAGSSLYNIAEVTGVPASTAMMILRRRGFPGRIRLLRMAGPVGSRVRGICRVRGCGVRHYGSGLCAKHHAQHRQGRIDKTGKLLTLHCKDCGKKLRGKPQIQRCELCRRTRKNILSKRNRDFHLGYIDKDGRPLPFICEQCGKKFRRDRKARFCEECSAARPNILRRLRQPRAIRAGV